MMLAAAAEATRHPGQGRARSRAVYLLDATLRSYSQILFTRSWPVGLLLLSATCVSPRVAAGGLLGVLLATATARLLHLSDDLIRSGLFGYNALLVGLGMASAFLPGPASVALFLVAVVGSVFVTAALHSALGSTWNLPVLTVPFILVYTLALAAAPSLQAAYLPVAGPPGGLAAYLALPEPAALFLRSLGALFFLPRVDAGLLVLAALVAYSRIGVVLALQGFALALLMGGQMVEVPDAMTPLVLGYNFVLVAVALGGVWFVPSISSFLFAAVAVLLCGLLTMGLLPFLTWNGVPVLILPFNLTLFLLLYAMRQRSRDSRPKSVDFLLGTPEENLSYFRTRLSRFGSHYWVRLSAPFLGRWTCTQGVDGDRTHQGPWRHAFDFEVMGSDGRPFRSEGRGLSDYLCYRLPVLASAAGTVVKVADGVKDNPVGEVNLEQNWGNLVVLCHGPGLYSMVCHLAQGSVKVKEGEAVRRGDPLGLCGNSGRSAVPHLHWQLQATARVGAPTLYAELHDVVREAAAADGGQGEGETRLHRTLVPEVGDVVRNLGPQDDVSRRLTLTYGEAITFELAGQGAGPHETVVPDIDLYGNLLLRSESRNAVLFYNLDETHFTVFDTLGRRGSALQLLQAALSRVPFESDERLVWRDVLPLRNFLPFALRMTLDLVSPFLQHTGIEMTYRSRREGGDLAIQGESLRRRRGGEPLVRTRAVLDLKRGIRELELTVNGKTSRAVQVLAPRTSQPPTP